MAKVIVAWCDPHMAHDEQVPGKSFQISINGGTPREIDLCEEHEKEFLVPVLELLGEVGQPIADAALPGMPTSPTGGVKRECNQPGCGKFLTREGMRKHMMTQHGMERVAGNEIVREIFGASDNVAVKVRACPECNQEFDTPQGLGAHRRSVHNVAGTKSNPARKAS